jgi:hypothetical protein
MATKRHERTQRGEEFNREGIRRGVVEGVEEFKG